MKTSLESCYESQTIIRMNLRLRQEEEKVGVECGVGWVEFPLISQIEKIGCGKVATSNEKQNPKRNFEIG